MIIFGFKLKGFMRFFLAVILVLCPLPAFAGTLSATSTDALNASGILWTIDTTTGAATQIATTSTGVGGDISWLDGTLYGNDFTSNRQGFGTIDPATGTVSTLSSYTGSDLAANPSLSEFYDVGAAASGMNIVSPGGSVITHINTANSTDFVDDLAYDSVHGILYGSTNVNTLLSIDTGTGIVTTIGTMFSGRGGGPIAYDWSTNTLYLIHRNSTDGLNYLYSLDITNATPSLIGQVDSQTGRLFSGFADLAGSPVPEPASMVLVGIGLVGLGFAKRRRNISL